jgi:hypothetical protein
MPNREDYIPESVRRTVAQRANYRCEYCLINEEDTYVSCEIDHITSLKHGGITSADNLAYACLPCNRHKGTDIGTLNEKGELVRLYHPRIDIWSQHFAISGSQIIGLTDYGKVTIKLLRFNDENKVEERAELQALKRYPLG